MAACLAVLLCLVFPTMAAEPGIETNMAAIVATGTAGSMPLASTKLYTQRRQYQSAIAAIKAGQTTKYINLADDLRTYPLYPYLDYTYKIYHLSRQKGEQIQSFIDQWPDTPLANQLRQNWLYNLAKRSQWAEFLAFHDPEQANDINACFHAYALFKVDQQTKAFAEARKLWLVGESQPDECDAIFKAWRDADLLTDDLGWQRFQLAMNNNATTLAAYLVRFVGKADKSLANAYQRARREPASVLKERLLAQNSPKVRQVISYSIKRLARQDVRAALAALQRYEQTHNVSEQDLQDLYAYVGVRLSNTGDPDNVLDRLPMKLTGQTDLLEARTRLALQQLDWGQALVMINLLEATTQGQPRWQYWKARILAGSTNLRDQQAAKNIFADIAQQRNFYGFLAADIIQQPYNYEDEPANINPEEILALEATPGIQRASELFALRELTRARREWRFTTRNFSVRERQIAARVSHGWGQYNQAIRAMIDAQAWNDLDIRFPLAFQESFINSARVAVISPQWSIAIARQESAFMTDARSGAGAMGLMQLMPATAKQTARRHGISYSSPLDLIDPYKNIKLGTAYLGNMFRRFNNNRVLASAAYNAGPSRVKRWINPALPLDVWIETIPFTETRNYVQNVLMFASIYSRRLNLNRPLIYPSEWSDFSQPNITQRLPEVAPRKG
ncbi:MAG: soluble lytic murein transglycosylase [Candidatus Pseudothioglobus sp.]|jgi:soluble lytic murein transglycosylase